MKSLNILIGLVLLIASSFIVACGQGNTKRQRIDEPIQPNKTQWKEVISNEGKFKIQFPGDSEYVIGDNPNTQNGKYYEYRLNTKLIAYSVSFGDFNYSKNPNNEELKKFYDIFQSKIAESDKRELLGGKDFQINEILGRETTYKKGNSILMERYIFNNNRLYQLLTTTSEDFTKDENIQENRTKFLESFQFLDK